MCCQVFYEPQTPSDVEATLREYAVAISSVSVNLVGDIAKHHSLKRNPLPAKSLVLALSYSL